MATGNFGGGDSRDGGGLLCSSAGKRRAGAAGETEGGAAGKAVTWLHHRHSSLFPLALAARHLQLCCAATAANASLGDVPAAHTTRV